MASTQEVHMWPLEIRRSSERSPVGVAGLAEVKCACCLGWAKATALSRGELRYACGKTGAVWGVKLRYSEQAGGVLVTRYRILS